VKQTSLHNWLHSEERRLALQVFGWPSRLQSWPNFEAQYFSSFPVVLWTPPSRPEKRETAFPVAGARAEIFLFCASGGPIRASVIRLDGQRVRGLLRGKTVESRTLKRCRSLGGEGECTGDFRDLRRTPLSGTQVNINDVFCADKEPTYLIGILFFSFVPPSYSSYPPPTGLFSS